MLCLAAIARGGPEQPTVLGVEGSRFTLNGRAEFLLGISYYGGLGAREEAARRVRDTDRERAAFVKDHFQKDARDPDNYDLIVNSSRFSTAACADLIVEALRRVQEPGPAAPPATEAEVP